MNNKIYKCKHCNKKYKNETEILRHVCFSNFTHKSSDDYITESFTTGFNLSSLYDTSSQDYSSSESFSTDFSGGDSGGGGAGGDW